MMEDYGMREFNIPEKIKEKLNDKVWVKKELAKGKSLQQILKYSDLTMAKFYDAAHKLFSRGHYSAATDAFLFLVTLNPKNYDFWLGYGMCLQMCSKAEEAIDAFEMASLINTENPVSYFYLAKCLFSLGEREEAMCALDLAIEYSSNDLEYQDLKQQAIKARKLFRSTD